MITRKLETYGMNCIEICMLCVAMFFSSTETVKLLIKCGAERGAAACRVKYAEVFGNP